MPFVRSMGDARRLETEFGYSIACHASMYTGKSIAEHGHWFVWLRDSARSRFPDSLHRVPAFADNIPTRVLGRKLLLRKLAPEDYPRGYFGVPRIISTPMRQWPGLWVSEERFWDEPGYAPTPTLFDGIRVAGLPHRVVGLHRGGSHLPAVETPLAAPSEATQWYYLFIGEVDHAAHQSGGEGAHFLETLRRADAAIAARCAEVQALHGGFDFVLFSDHGHLKVESYIDLYRRLSSSWWRRVPHIVDTNFARFWTDSPAEKARLTDELERSLPEGRVLSQEEQERWECWFPDERYGDVIYYLDAPYAFSRTAWGFSRSEKSVHGYSPEIEEMAATFVTNMTDLAPTRLRDMYGLHINRLGLC